MRKISFLTLDSLYAPVPFSLRLTSIVLSFGQYYEEIFIKKSAYKSAIEELEKVLQNSVYLNNDSIINTNKASLEVSEQLGANVVELDTLRGIYRAINCSSVYERQWRAHNEPDWNERQTLALDFERATEFIPACLNDPIAWEIEFRNRVGVTKTRVGALTNPKKSSLRVCVAVNDTAVKSRIRSTLKITVELIKLLRQFDSSYINPRSIENQSVLFTTILKSVFGWDKRFILQPHDNRYSPYIIENGKAKSINAIDAYIRKVETAIKPDQLLEIKETKNALEKYGYSGLTLAFLGATKVFSSNQNNESAEFDGLLIFPTIKEGENFFYIIESKNINNGFNESQKQLQKRIRTIISSEFSWTVDKLSPKAAIGRVKIS